MAKKYVVLMAAVLTLVMSGCATQSRMAFQDDTESVEKVGKPVFLMTATLKNDYHKFYQPQLRVVNIEKSEVNGSADRINFTMDEKAKGENILGEDGNSYLLRMALDNGSYVIRGLTGFSGAFPVHGTFFAPLHSDLSSQGGGVYYLGHVEATVRERQGDEFRAGPVIPLLDQAVTGFSGGTFDIAIVDRYDQDVQVFIEKFPALKNVTIQKALLPDFDREKAQNWWEEN